MVSRLRQADPAQTILRTHHPAATHLTHTTHHHSADDDDDEQ